MTHICDIIRSRKTSPSIQTTTMHFLRRHAVRPAPVAKLFVKDQQAPPVQLAPSREQTIVNSLRFFTTLSQILGILPVEHVNTDARFKWLSWKTFYTGSLALAFGVAAVCCLVHWMLEGSSINSMATAVFFSGPLITMVLYLQLGRNWAKLMKSWRYIDRRMNACYGYPSNLDRIIVTFTIVFLILGLADNALSLANRYEELYHFHGNLLSFRIYFEDLFPQLFAFVPFSAGTAIFCTVLTIHANFTWAMNDLLIIITSSALALRFRQIFERLTKDCQSNKVSSILFWKEIREDYDRLASFCKELDSYLSSIVLLSYFLNIFFLLIQLYHGLESISLTVGKIYFIFSFSYLIFKTTTVSLYAAWINDESKAPSNLLNSVDSSYYNIEVASAIVTYELVLIQFSQARM